MILCSQAKLENDLRTLLQRFMENNYENTEISDKLRVKAEALLVTKSNLKISK